VVEMWAGGLEFDRNLCFFSLSLEKTLSPGAHGRGVWFFGVFLFCGVRFIAVMARVLAERKERRRRRSKRNNGEEGRGGRERTGSGNGGLTEVRSGRSGVRYGEWVGRWADKGGSPAAGRRRVKKPVVL